MIRVSRIRFLAFEIFLMGLNRVRNEKKRKFNYLDQIVRCV